MESQSRGDGCNDPLHKMPQRVKRLSIVKELTALMRLICTKGWQGF